MKLIDALKNRERGAVIKHDHFFSVYDSHLYQYKDKSVFTQGLFIKPTDI